MPPDEDDRGRIKVTDRRPFTSSGERRTPEEADPGGTAGHSATTVQGEGFELRRPTEPAEGQAGDPEVGFTSFILSLASTAFIHLGEMEDPVTGRKELNPPAARQIIDIIDMLRVRTRGNLESREEEFLAGILTELKMTFARKAAHRS